MRFTFLGTGTSSGVPAIACDCAVCASADPRDHRLRTGAAIRFVDPHGHDRTVLIDATPDLRQQAIRAGLRRCDAILFTHNHVDHTFGLDEVRRFNVVQRSPVDVFAEPSTLAHLRRVYTHIFDHEANVNDSFVATLIPHPLDPDSPFDLFGLRVTPVRLLHGRLPVLGFRFDAPEPHPHFPLAYCTDVSAIPPESWPRLRGLRTLVLDALRRRKHPTHLTLDEAVNIADRVGARRTLFVHMAHDLAHAETDASLPEGMRLAYDGLTLGPEIPE
ncbi:MAG: MBL fold metallo-hydrolase [Phycisphaerae bacterium]|nr:MBL fold metallo-hydrolase [Phycisphaerae bacterium]